MRKYWEIIEANSLGFFLSPHILAFLSLNPQKHVLNLTVPIACARWWVTPAGTLPSGNLVQADSVSSSAICLPMEFHFYGRLKTEFHVKHLVWCLHPGLEELQTCPFTFLGTVKIIPMTVTLQEVLHHGPSTLQKYGGLQGIFLCRL